MTTDNEGERIFGSFDLITSEIGFPDNGNEIITTRYIVMCPNKKYRSSRKIWHYFGIAKKENASPSEAIITDRIVCLLCLKNDHIQTYKKSTSSGNLWKHLFRKHEILLPKGIGSSIFINQDIFDENSFIVDDEQISNLNENEDEPHVVSTIKLINLPSEFSEAIDYKSNEDANEMKHTNISDIGILLIKEIAKRPYIYQNTHGPGMKKGKRDQLWNEIYESFGKSIEVKRLQKIWKNMRDRYRKVKNMEKLDIPNFDGTQKYKYYEYLKFLDDEMNLVTNQFEELSQQFEGVDEPPEKKICLDNYNLIIEDNTYEEFIMNDVSDTNCSIISEVSNISSEHVKTEEISSEPTVEKSTDQKHEINIESLSEVGTQTDQIEQQNDNYKFHSSSNQKSDELELFGKLIAEKMRNFTNDQRDDLQIKILQLLRNKESPSTH